MSEMVTFAAQSTPGDTQCFPVTVFNDTLRESDETFSLVLTSQEVAVDLERNELVITIEEGEFAKFKLRATYKAYTVVLFQQM